MLKEAKYEKMRKDILARILSDQFPDKRLPSIKQLADTYGVSLMTANRAVKLLEEAGIVRCCPGNIGTVIDQKKAALYCSEQESKHIWTDINSFIEKQIKIKYLCSDFTADSKAIWDDLAKCFNKKYPWAEVEIMTSDCVERDLADKREYDVIQIFGRDVEAYQRRGLLMNLTELVNSTIDEDSYLANTLSNCCVNDNFFSLPMMLNVPVIFYNKKYLGSGTDEMSKDWKSFFNAVKTTVAEGNYSAMNLGLASVMHYFIGDIHNLTSSIVEREALVEMFNILKYITLAAPNDFALQPANVVESFLRQDIFFFCAYSAYIGEITQKSNFEWGILPLPQAQNGTPVMETSVNGINPESSHKKEAWLFVKFLCSEDAQNIITRNRKYIPANKRSFENEYTRQEPKTAQILKDIILQASPSSVSSQNLYTIYSLVFPVLENYYSTHQQLDDTVDKVLDCINEMLMLEHLD
jgi:ABC-type glycerol-3-phosphate transport system substrate-binding protein